MIGEVPRGKMGGAGEWVSRAHVMEEMDPIFHLPFPGVSVLHPMPLTLDPRPPLEHRARPTLEPD